MLYCIVFVYWCCTGLQEEDQRKRGEVGGHKFNIISTNDNSKHEPMQANEQDIPDKVLQTSRYA